MYSTQDFSKAIRFPYISCKYVNNNFVLYLLHSHKILDVGIFCLYLQVICKNYLTHYSTLNISKNFLYYVM